MNRPNFACRHHAIRRSWSGGGGPFCFASVAAEDSLPRKAAPDAPVTNFSQSRRLGFILGQNQVVPETCFAPRHVYHSAGFLLYQTVVSLRRCGRGFGRPCQENSEHSSFADPA